MRVLTSPHPCHNVYSYVSTLLDHLPGKTLFQNVSVGLFPEEINICIGELSKVMALPSANGHYPIHWGLNCFWKNGERAYLCSLSARAATFFSYTQMRALVLLGILDSDQGLHHQPFWFSYIQNLKLNYTTGFSSPPACRHQIGFPVCGPNFLISCLDFFIVVEEWNFK